MGRTSCRPIPSPIPGSSFREQGAAPPAQLLYPVFVESQSRSRQRQALLPKECCRSCPGRGTGTGASGATAARLGNPSGRPAARAAGQPTQWMWGQVLASAVRHPLPQHPGLQPLHRAHSGVAQPMPRGWSSPQDPLSHGLSSGMLTDISRLHTQTHVPITHRDISRSTITFPMHRSGL